jgi:hypothetical protein
MQDVPRLKTPKGVHISCTYSEHLDQELNNLVLCSSFQCQVTAGCGRQGRQCIPVESCQGTCCTLEEYLLKLRTFVSVVFSDQCNFVPLKAATVKQPDKHDRKEDTFQIPAHQQDSWQHLQPSVMAPYETSAISAPREILIQR